MGEENRVLSWAELCALPEGATVYLDERDAEFPSEMATVCSGHLCAPDGTFYALGEDEPSWFYVGMSDESNGMDWRVWLREPTPDELAANPWPDTKEE